MNHSSSEATVRDCRPGRVCVSVTKKQKERKKKPTQKKHLTPPREREWGQGKRDSGPTALMDSFLMSDLRQLAAHSFVRLPDLLGNLKGCCYL